MDSEKRNILLAGVFSLVVLLGWNYLFPPKQAPAPVTSAGMTVSQAPTPERSAETTIQGRNEALSQGQRIRIRTPNISGSILLAGARLDDITLNNYHETTDPESGKINLFSPSSTSQPHSAEFGWVSDDKNIAVPSTDTLWKADREELTQDAPLTLSWDNGQGVVFEQIISIDDQYLFTITQRVHNHSGKNVSLAPWGAIRRSLPESVSDFFILHEGPIGYLSGKLVDPKYKDIHEKGTISHNTKGGWTGITDKYWLSALIPDQKESLKVDYRLISGTGREMYQADYLGSLRKVDGNGTTSFTGSLFAGPKILAMLDGYEEKLGVEHFDLAVDFGWYYIITKPIFYILTHAKQWLGNFGLAIMLLTVILKLLFFPLANKSYRSMARMKTLQPKLEKLRERYQNDRIRMNQEMMELYKKEKVNPMAGCLPMVVQIPVFFALYKVLFVTIEMRHAPFFGWITDLSSPDPTTIFNLFGLIPWTPPSFLMIGAWPLIMGATMLAQQKLNPAPADPIQAKMFMLLPIVFTFMLAQFPAGLVIYWAWNNILSIIQQWSIMRMSQTTGATGK